MRRTIILAILICTGAVVAFGDEWAFPAKVTKKPHEFGKSRIVLEVDATRNQSYPDHTLLIYLDGDLMAKYKNIGFDQIFASPKHNYFVGLSNSGIPGTAFVVFDNKGNLLREVKHRFFNPRLYTRRSEILTKKWYNSEKPDVQFEVHNGRLHKVLVVGSNQSRYNLLHRTLGFVTAGKHNQTLQRK